MPTGRQAVAGRTIPALDGVRALAIVAVLVYHLGFGWAAGGYLGVDLFFVLSGFLITSLLVERWMGTGAVELRRFWGRRARRLLPGLLVMLVAVVGFVALESSGLPIDWHGLREEALATVGYVANWQLLWSHQSYFDRFAMASPLRHTWSLAIEEQFYVLWPLVVVGLVRLRSWRKAGLAVSVLGAVLSAAWMAYLFRHGASIDRLYYGTDTRAFDLLAGAALAMAVVGRPQPSGRTRRLLDAGAFAALAALIGISAVAGSASGLPRPFMFEGGFALAALCCLALLASLRCTDPGLLGRPFSWGPARYLGRISYGLYLWHWPVIVEVDQARTGMAGLALAAVRAAIALALAIASYHLVEQPIRTGWPNLRRAWRRVALAPGAMAATAAVILASTVPPTATTASAGVVRLASAAVPGAGGVVGRPIELGRQVSARHPLRLLLLGDSVMLSEAPATEALFGATGEAVVENHSQWGFGLSELKGWQLQVPEWIRAARPQLVVAMWSWDNAAYAAHPAAYERSMEQFISIVLAAGHVKGIVFQQFPVPGPGDDAPGSPDYPARVPKLIARFDALEQKMAARHPGKVVYVPLGSAVTWHGKFATWLPPEGRPHAPTSEWTRVRQVDGVHFCPAGAARYAAGLYADLRRWYHLTTPRRGWEHGAWTRNYLAYEYPNSGVCPDDHP